jgi:collagen type VII alpha
MASSNPPAGSDRFEILFVDPSAPDPQAVEAALRPGVTLVRLDAEIPALPQIASALRGHPEIGTVHVLAHGAPGVIQFAAGAVGTDNLPQHKDVLAEIARLLDGGEIMLWSCHAGAGE